MIWLVWRRYRTEALVAALAVAVVGAALFGVGWSIDLSNAQPGRVELLAVVLNVVRLVPFGIGALLGVPLLARELASGTWQLAWTQAVPRLRWLAVQLAVLGGLTVALTGGMTALVTWYRRPEDALNGAFPAFSVEGIVPSAYALFAFALAIAAGLLIRRSLPALAAALAVFLPVRYAARLVRPHLQPPRTGIRDDTTTGAWILHRVPVDATGRVLTADELTQSRGSLAPQELITYHPAGRFWPFQLIEAGIFLALTALVLALVVWLVRRRAW